MPAPEQRCRPESLEPVVDLAPPLRRRLIPGHTGVDGMDGRVIPNDRNHCKPVAVIEVEVRVLLNSAQGRAARRTATATISFESRSTNS
ncbi:MAG: hypothetical protein R3B97_09030 [Dehalococcoidia bacterium]